MLECVELPPAVENLILQVQVRHLQKVSPVARWLLRKAGEENAGRILTETERAFQVHNLSGFIVDKVKKCLGCSPPLVPCGERASDLGDSWVSPAGSVAGAFRVWDSVRGVKEETHVVQKCGPCISDGLSDEALLAIDIERAASPLIRRYSSFQENGVQGQGNVTAAGDCKSWGEGPTSALVQQMPLVPSQGSNDSVECGNGIPLPCHSELPCYLECTPKPEPDTFLGTPSSVHSVEPSSSQKKRLVGSVDDGSSGSRNVKTKARDGNKQTQLFEFYNQQSRFPASPDPLTCGSPVLARPILGDSVFADARKLDFGPEPINPPPDPQSSEVINPKPEHTVENAHPKECAFRYKECALQRSELADPEVARVYGQLSFTKRFLVLDHNKELHEFPSVKELEALKLLRVEEVDNRLHHRFSRPAHIAMRDWSKLGNGHLVFTCHVSHSGKYEFLGPRFENGGTPLQRAFGQENVLIVKFEDTAIDHHTILDRYRCLARHGILCGLKKFVFYAFKDAESKKKQGVSKNSTYGCRCIFLAINSYASADTKDNIKKFKSIAEARRYIMHPTVPSLAKAISRLQLALSQTTQIPLDFSKVHVERIDDIPCLDESGKVVRDANGKPLIHTDGCGYVSKNLAILCQDIVIKGIKQQSEKVNQREKQEYPLMMQVRIFEKGNLWKGVLVVNLKLPDNTIQVRPSMLKVERDNKLQSATFNSLELCNTSRKPSDARLFQHLILLLKLGGVKEEVLLKYVETSIEKLRKYFTDCAEALNVAVRHIDSHHSGEIACEMLMTGLEPGKEPFLQKVLSEMVKSNLHNYSLGKVPVPDAAYLMGCADPTGLLERNQVAILVGNGSRICRERVIVYKPPGLHTGDVHIFEATWIKEIEAVVGTSTYGIIFSTKGARSITDEMAGSDLDGDQYWVSWNPELVDSFNPGPPWEAPNIKDEEPLPRPTDEDEFERLHFSKFLQVRFKPSIIKGRSANSWLALTDCTMSRNVDKKDQILAKGHIPTVVNLFYESLDAEKSGKEVRWPSQLQCSVYPHFLEKNKDEAGQDSNKLQISSCGRKRPAKKFEEYTSTSILGRVYDLVKKEDFDKPVNVEIDKTFEYDGYKDYHQLWRCQFAEYNCRTSNALQELELRSSNEQDFRNCVYNKLLAEYKKMFLGEGKSKEQLLKEASAIYTVVYGKAEVKESQALQFAWKIAGSQLCNIYADKREGYMCLARQNLNFFLGR